MTNSTTSAAEIPISVSSALSPLPKSIALAEGHLELIPQLRRVKEERTVVGRRPDIVVVVVVERVPIGGEDQPRVVGRRAVHPLGRQRRPAARRRAAARTARRSRAVERLAAVRRISAGVNARFLSRNVATRPDWTMARRSARVPAAALAGLLCERDEPQAVEDPPRHRHHAVVGEVIEVVVERLDGVQRVLGQRVGARGGRRPGVHERRLDDVVAIRRPPHEAAAVVHGDAHARVRVDAARELAELRRA